MGNGLSDVRFLDKVQKALNLESGELGSSPNLAVYYHESLRQVAFSAVFSSVTCVYVFLAFPINVIRNNEFASAL